MEILVTVCSAAAAMKKYITVHPKQEFFLRVSLK
jgi:hypothetical protein